MLLHLTFQTGSYTVTYEQAVADTGGRADIVLRRGKQAIACEISITTPADYEVASVRKCLQGGFTHVAVIAPSRSKLVHIEELVAASISAEQAAQVGYYGPEEFIARLFDWAAADPEGGLVEKGKPRKQRIQLTTSHLTEGERAQLETQMLKRLAAAMKGSPPE